MGASNLDRIPNILKSFPTSKRQQPDNQVYSSSISHYLSLFYPKNPETIPTVLYEILINLFGSIKDELYQEKESKGELKNIKLLWWESEGVHRAVDAEYYLANWQKNYARLAENWKQIVRNPDNMEKIEKRIKWGIAGLLYVRDYEDTIFATLKYQQQIYQRLKKRTQNKKPPLEYRDKYGQLVMEIVEYASSLPFDKGINFLGELSGAYILSCPIEKTIVEPMHQNAPPERIFYSVEENFVMALLTQICLYGSQEVAMSASELPLRYVKKPGEDWKFSVEIS